MSPRDGLQVEWGRILVPFKRNGDFGLLAGFPAPFLLVGATEAPGEERAWNGSRLLRRYRDAWLEMVESQHVKRRKKGSTLYYISCTSGCSALVLQKT